MTKLTDLKFNTCAYFYKLKDKQSISKKDIQDMLKNVTEDKISGNFLFNSCRNNGSKNTKYSLRIFKNKPKTPSFIGINDPNWVEQKIGYYLFIEYEDYVAILRKYCTVPKQISDKLEGIDYDRLIGLYSNKETEFKRLSMQNLDGSDFAMRYKSYEALNLKDNVSPIGSSHYFIRSMKGNNGDDRFALTLYSSRINDLQSDFKLDAICQWVQETVDQIKDRTNIKSNFLNIFAKPEKYANNIEKLKPSSLLIFYGLITTIHDDQNASFYNVLDDGCQKIIDNETFNRDLGMISQCYEKVNSVERKGKKHYYTGINDSIEICLLKSGIKLRNKNWDNIVIIGSENNQYDGPLSDLINKYSLFNVYFTDTELVYNNRTLLRDTKLISSALHFSDVMQAKLIGNFTCEKHLSRSAKGLNNWDDESIFKYVEDTFMNDYTYFICEDYNSEWADHIGISKDRVTFFVEKHKYHKNVSDTATEFQDVVAQALKNIANLIPTREQLNDKRTRWKGKYLKSNMKRYRSNTGNIDDAIKEWLENNQRPNCKREMCLVVDFLSKIKFKQQLNNLKAEEHEAELRMRLWLLSSFVTSCLEYSVTPLIYCKE